MNVNSLKILTHKLYLFYLHNVSFKRGKYRLGVLVHSLVGDALYNVAGINLLLSPVCALDRQLIEGYGHDSYVADAILNALKDGGNFIDIGAHFGYMSLLAAKLLKKKGRVFSFEPSPREYKKLIRHIGINNFYNIKAFNKGIAEHGKPYYLNISFLGNTGANSRYSIERSIGRIQAEFLPIRDVLSSAELALVRCVKIDTEGDEISVLKGLENAMDLLHDATFIVEITRDLLRVSGYQTQDIYDFFSKYSFKPLEGKGLKDYSQYDEVFVPA
ncbi:MAG: FkbM family methyltransferase [Candidatus Omnitrophica bacterium]|nr:FkbM family methyltransferase [Candidatus Omnitrophota bacterium]